MGIDTIQWPPARRPGRSPVLAAVIVTVMGFLRPGCGDGSLLSPEEIEAILKRSPVKTIYVVASSHWDLGFADPTDVVQDRVKVHLDEAIRNCEKEPRLRWMVESVWQVLEWLKRTPREEERERLFRLVRQGRIGISAAFGGMHTARMSTEEMFRFLYDGQTLAAGHELKLDTVMMDDVPGYSWALPQVLTECGVSYFLTGVNTRFGGRLQIGRWEQPFWWVGPDGSRVLTYICAGYNEAARWLHTPPTAARFFAQAFGKPWLKSIRDLDRIQDLGVAAALLELEKAGYQHPYLLTLSSMDFISSDRAVVLLHWIDRWNERHSAPRMVLCTPSQFFAEVVKRDTSELPEYRGDFAGLWETGSAGAPAFRAHVNGVRESLGMVETVWTLASALEGAAYPYERIQDLTHSLLQVHEHGFGLGVSWPNNMTLADVLHNNTVGSALAGSADETAGFLLRRGVSELCRRAAVEEPTVLVFNPLPWTRNAQVQVCLDHLWTTKPFALIDESSGKPVTYDLNTDTALLQFFAQDLPSVGYRRYRLRPGPHAVPEESQLRAADGHVQNRTFLLKVDPSTGTVLSLLHRPSGRELLDTNGPKFGRLVRRSHRNDFTGADAFSPADNSPAEVTYAEGATYASLSIARTQSVLALIRFTLFSGDDRLHIEMVLAPRRTRQVPFAEHSDHYYAVFEFGFPTSDLRFQLDGPAGWIDSHRDYLPGAVRTRFIVHHMAEMSDDRGFKVALAPRESEILQFGFRAPRGANFSPDRPALLFKLFSDADEGKTRDLGVVPIPPPPGEDKPVAFHFTLWAGTDAPASVRSYRLGREQACQPLAFYLPAARKPPFRSWPPRLPPTRSFLQVQPDHVELLTLKRPQDGDHRDLVFRFRELNGQPADVTVTMSFPLERARWCDGLERASDQRPCEVSPLRFRLRPHQWATIRATLAPDDADRSSARRR